MHTYLPAALAILSAVALALGTVLRSRGTTDQGKVGRLWLIGVGVSFVSFVLQASALSLGTILLVQPLLVLSVLFALPMEARLAHRHLSNREWLWGALAAISVGAFLLFARPEPSPHGYRPLVLSATVGGLLLILIALAVWAYRCDRSRRALLLGIVTGSLFGISAPLIKTVSWQLLHHPVRMLEHPDVYLFLVVAGAALFFQQQCFRLGDVQNSFPAMIVMEPLVSMALGMAALGERIDVHSVFAILAGLSLAGMTVSVLALARMSGARQQAAEGQPVS